MTASICWATWFPRPDRLARVINGAAVLRNAFRSRERRASIRSLAMRAGKRLPETYRGPHGLRRLMHDLAVIGAVYVHPAGGRFKGPNVYKGALARAIRPLERIFAALIDVGP